jgi:ADP-heptose:LPS heptosyltransferase
VGTSYRWYSFLYNKRIPVHRSKCERHESDYNLDLVRALGAERLKPYPVFPVNASDREYARLLLKEKGLGSGDRLLVVHPGSKGSALNWKPEKYAEAVGRLSKLEGVRVVVSGGPGEEKTVQRLLYALPGRIRPPATMVDECSLRQMAAVLKTAACVLSASTGIMHLAAAVNTPTVSLFGNRSLVLQPDGLRCPECRKGSCRQHDPMEGVTVERAYQGVKMMLDARGTRR